MEGPGLGGSLREGGEGGALPERGALAQDTGPSPPRSFSTWASDFFSSLLTSFRESPRIASLLTSLRESSIWESLFSAQKASASSPPLAQVQALQENETLNEENPQPNEQLQDSEYVKVKDFTIQVRVTGRTGDCEEVFLKEVHDHLFENYICLKREDYREDSNHFLLVFCPVASRVGTDMQNALEGLQGEPKAILVMLHHRPKEYDHFLDTKLQAQHPAVVLTVHARYTLEDGFYDCQVNEEAMAAVAEVLKVHFKKEPEKPPTPDHLKEEPEKPITPDHLKEEPEKPPTPDHLNEEPEKPPTPDPGDQM